MNTNPAPAQQIKEATAQAHASTEKAMIKYIKNIRTAEDYASLLTCMYGYFKPLEQQFDVFVATIIPGYNERRKAGKLLDDIRSLGCPDPQHFSSQLPRVTDQTSALACFYVLEGSILGGAVIKKIINQQCPGIPATAFSFFSGYNENTMQLWQAFIAWFNTSLSSATAVQQAAVTANECFSLLESWIREYYREKAAV